MNRAAVTHSCQRLDEIIGTASDLVGVAGFEPTAPRSQSLGRPCAVVCTGRITCADVVVKLARDGCRRKPLLHGCYTVDLDAGVGRHSTGGHFEGTGG